MMKDVEYVRQLLTTDYASERSHEIPYPSLKEVIDATEFDYLAGTVLGETPNGAKSREGEDYLWFQHGGKSILTHRFISALSIGKWVPRECDIDHVNHNPSDNRPTNLRITTPRDNQGNRREALLSELVNIDEVDERLRKPKPVPEPPRVVQQAPIEDKHLFLDKFYPSSPAPSGRPLYTGVTKPGHTSGTYYGTTWMSWHWYPEGEKPDPSEYEK